MTASFRVAALVLFSLTLCAEGVASQNPLQFKTIPATPLIENSRDQQSMNFDIMVRNTGSRPLTLLRIEGEAFDAAGQPISRKLVSDNGFPSSIETLPDRTVPAHGELGIFNPLYAWPQGADVSRLRYTLTFTDSKSGAAESATLSVSPQLYHDKTQLIVPLKGRLFVQDGHDFYAHHRRQDLSDPAAVQAGIVANPMRYALDLAFVDEHGAMYRAIHT